MADIKTVADRFDELSELETVCSTLRIPIPHIQEIANIRLGRLLPFQDYGCVLRIENKDFLAADTPCTLQPIASLGTIYNGRYSVKLYPSVPQVGISITDHVRLKSAFYKAGHALASTRQDDCGYLLDEKATGLSRYVPVLLDVTDTYKIDEKSDLRTEVSGLICSRLFETKKMEAQLAALQNRLYARLQEKCSDLLSSPNNLKEHRAEKFWRAMRQAAVENRGDGLSKLGAGWKQATSCFTFKNKAEEKRNAVDQASVRYALRFNTDPFHKAILQCRVD